MIGKKSNYVNRTKLFPWSTFLMLIISALFIMSFIDKPVALSEDCKTLLQQKIDYQNDSLILTNLRTVLNCHFDSIEVAILSRPEFMGTILVSLSKNSLEITYQDFINEVCKIKSIPNFEEIKRMIEHPIKPVKSSEQNSVPIIGYSTICDTTETFKIKNIITYSNYEKALDCSQQINKPLLIYFSGWTCVISRKFEDQVWVSQKVNTLLADSFVVATLFCDDKTSLPPDQQYYSLTLEDTVKTFGQRNLHLEQETFGNIYQPFFVIIKPDGIAIPGTNVQVKDDFMNFLNQGLE